MSKNKVQPKLNDYQTAYNLTEQLILFTKANAPLLCPSDKNGKCFKGGFSTDCTKRCPLKCLDSLYELRSLYEHLIAYHGIDYHD